MHIQDGSKKTAQNERFFHPLIVDNDGKIEFEGLLFKAPNDLDFKFFDGKNVYPPRNVLLSFLRIMIQVSHDYDDVLATGIY